MSPKILVVNDDAALLEGLQRILSKQFKIAVALSGAEALQRIGTEGPFALVVADLQMPDMSGLDFLREVQARAPESIRIMLTGDADQKTAVDAVKDGRVFRVLTKPYSAEALVPVLEAGLEQYHVRQIERDLLTKTLGGALKVLSEILSQQDPDTFERGQRLRASLREYGMYTRSPISWELEMAATLHALGRVTVPPAVLEKFRHHEPLTLAEGELIQQIPELGARLLQGIPKLEGVVAIIRYQQKRFDGTGYPADALAGREIPFGARLLKIFSDLAELESTGHSSRRAWKALRQRAGWYDPELFARVERYRAAKQASANATLQEVPVEQLSPGDVLVQDLTTGDGRVLLAASSELTPMLHARLRNFQKLYSLRRTILIHR